MITEKPARALYIESAAVPAAPGSSREVFERTVARIAYIMTRSDDDAVIDALDSGTFFQRKLSETQSDGYPD